MFPTILFEILTGISRNSYVSVTIERILNLTPKLEVINTQTNKQINHNHLLEQLKITHTVQLLWLICLCCEYLQQHESVCEIDPKQTELFIDVFLDSAAQTILVSGIDAFVGFDLFMGVFDK